MNCIILNKGIELISEEGPVLLGASGFEESCLAIESSTGAMAFQLWH